MDQQSYSGYVILNVVCHLGVWPILDKITPKGCKGFESIQRESKILRVEHKTKFQDLYLGYKHNKDHLAVPLHPLWYLVSTM